MIKTTEHDFYRSLLYCPASVRDVYNEMVYDFYRFNDIFKSEEIVAANYAEHKETVDARAIDSQKTWWNLASINAGANYGEIMMLLSKGCYKDCEV